MCVFPFAYFGPFSKPCKRGGLRTYVQDKHMYTPVQACPVVSHGTLERAGTQTPTGGEDGLLREMTERPAVDDVDVVTASQLSYGHEKSAIRFPRVLLSSRISLPSGSLFNGRPPGKPGIRDAFLHVPHTP